VSNGGGESRGQDPVVACFGGGNSGAVDVATACNAKPGNRDDFESETFVVGTLCGSGKAAGSATQQDAEGGLLGAHSLRADGFDASGDGTGRGTPLVPIAFHATQNPISGEVSPAIGQGSSAGCGRIAVCFSSKDDGADAGDLAPTLRAAGHDGSHANAGAPPAVTVAQALKDIGEKFGGTATIAAVRRLTPLECERLMGDPDEWTAIKIPTAKQKAVIVKSYRDAMSRTNQCVEPMTLREAWKDAADGPRYKSIGNSMAVPVMAWIGRRVAEATR